MDGSKPQTSALDTPGTGATRPPALDHGAIGNGRLIALVSPTSAIEWLCLPRFDSPSVFGRLLDRRIGGTWRILHGDQEVAGKLQYIPNTNVLRTVFEHDGASWEVIDFAPRLPDGLGVQAPIEVVRLLRPLGGEPRLRIDFDPRPDYGRTPVRLIESADSIVVEGAPDPLFLYTDLPLLYITGRREFVLDRPVCCVLTYGRRAAHPSLAELHRDLELTIAGWRAWARTCALPAFAPEAVLRSALCLKLHTAQDTGAIIAATTTSIPEAMNTPRTWDYRYCWLRDAAFVVEALRRLSHLSEGEMFIRFLRDVAESGPLQPVYAIDGHRSLDEEMLDHLAGFGGNGHVRIGNAAYHQKQNDLMGELVLCLDTLITDPRIIQGDYENYFPLIRRLVEEALAAAPTPDTGIWEFRSMLRHYTFSKAMCWAAAERGSSLARRLGHRDDADRWAAAAARLQEEVLQRGYNRELGYFTQAFDGVNPDASNLLLPTLGLLDARDPRFVSTVDAYSRLLVQDGLVLRYRNDDDFGPVTSSFTICSFWFAEALALIGRLDEAKDLCNRLLAYANPLGLFSEDIDPATGALLGNFPQAYTHVGLIHAATTIGDLEAAHSGKVRAWA